MTLESTNDTPGAFPITSMDWQGYWLPMFGAIWEAFYITPFWGYSSLCNTTSTTGSCSLTRNMGTWSHDGVAATPMQNAADLRLLEGIPGYCAP
jgi:hypothetical protein